MTRNTLLHMNSTNDRLIELLRSADAFLLGQVLPERPRFVANLALEEILTNIIKYGYDDSEEHVISVAISVADSDIAIEVEDDGHEFDPLSVPAPDTGRPIEDCQPGGLGIHLVRQLTDSVEYSRDGNRNRLKMRIQIPLNSQ